jgi:hypothetical protein
MTGSGFQKTGWHWTRKGWKRTPKHLQKVKKVPVPSKRRFLKRVQVAAAQGEKVPTFAETRKSTAEQPKPVSAPTPATDATQLATGQPRKPWLGKYDDLHHPPEQG